jgi:O-antigen ligase
MADRPLISTRVDPWVTRGLLWLGVVLCCVVGLLTPYIVGVMGIVLLLAVLVRRQWTEAYSGLAARLFLGAFVALGVSFAVTATELRDALSVFNFTGLLLFGPFVLLLGRQTNGNMMSVARLAALGAALAFAVGMVSRLGLGYARADTPLLGAILLANTAVLLGFLAVPGVLLHPDARRRWLYLLPPLLGVATVAVTASRGPMVSIAPLVVFCAIVVARQLRVRPLAATGATALYLVVCAAILFGFNDRVPTLSDVASEMSAGSEVSDTNASIRLAFYEAGFRAFLDAPVIGHGWRHMMTAVGPYLSDEMREFLWLPHLHNDIIDFAVAAGVIGVVIYFTILFTPLVAALRSTRDALYPHRLFAVAILVIAYAFDGLTDLMFGMEYHTMLFVVLSAILLGWCRERPA